MRTSDVYRKLSNTGKRKTHSPIIPITVNNNDDDDDDDDHDDDGDGDDDDDDDDNDNNINTEGQPFAEKEDITSQREDNVVSICSYQ